MLELARHGILPIRPPRSAAKFAFFPDENISSARTPEIPPRKEMATAK